MLDSINTSFNPIKRKKLPYQDFPRYKLIFAYEKKMVQDYDAMLLSMVNGFKTAINIPFQH